MTHPMLRISVFISILIFAQSSIALETDKNKPAYMWADSSDINYKTGVDIFTGHVKLDQGTTHLRGDKLIAQTNNKNRINKVVVYGNKAHYTTQEKPYSPPFHAQAKKITYYPMTGLAYLDGKALTRQGGNSLSGNHIQYDTHHQQGKAKPKKNGRITLVISPEGDHE